MGTSEQSGALKDRDMWERAPDRVPGLSKGWGSRGARLTQTEYPVYPKDGVPGG